MIKYLFACFHIAIITFFLTGCGYKAPPTWVDSNTTKKVEKSDLKILDINSTINIK